MKKVSLLFLTVLMVTSTGAFASGLAIPEQGAAAMGMSAAMTARSEDLSAIYYNPAGIEYVQKSEIFLGITPIKPVHKYEGATESDTAKKLTFVPPNVYYARRYNSRVVLGVGLFSPYGLGTDWRSEWYGRYTSTYGEIKSVYVTPAVSIKLHDMVTLGASYSWIWSGASIKKKIDTGLALYSTLGSINPAAADPRMVANPSDDSEFSLDGDGGGLSYTFGLMFRPVDRLQIGVTYTGKSEITYSGHAKFDLQADIIRHPVSSTDSLISKQFYYQFPYSQKGEAVLNLPSSVNVGIKYDLTPAWDAEVDLNFVNWSSYNKLTIDLQNDLPMDKFIWDKNWDNTMVFRFGTSYDVNEKSVARFGLLYDQSPVPDNTFDAQLPDNNRFGLSVGYGYKIGNLNLDFSYMFLSFSDRDKDNLVGYVDAGSFDTEKGEISKIKDGVVDATDKAILDGMMNTMGRGDYPVGSGTYKSSANLISVSASYKF